ncbi:triose-phosphate isomerase, partial [Odoribacter laneus]
KTLPEGIQLAEEVNEKVKALQVPEVKVILGTPFIHLAEVSKIVDPAIISISAQNCATEASGAYTGEISAAMVASTGSTHVILGHSERRSYYGETDAILVKKVAQALVNQLEIIFCIGEVLAEREAGKHFEVVKSQLENGLFQLSPEEFSHIILAYEPVWAIGTGKTATSAQAQEMHAFIRKVLTEKYGKEIAENTSILYGGSCNAKNADELFANPDVDGGLIGGASLKAEDFSLIIAARAKH